MADLGGLSVDAAELGALVAAGDRAVLVEFWAPWCGTCRLMAPTLERLARDEAARARVVAVNVAEAAELAEAHGVRALPTILIFAGGAERARLQGLRSHAALVAELDALAPA